MWTHIWVMLHVNESWHICMSHGTYEWVISCEQTSAITRQINGHSTWEPTSESCHTWMSHTAYESVMPHEWDMSHINESRHTRRLVQVEDGSTVTLAGTDAYGVSAHGHKVWQIMSHVSHEWVMDTRCDRWMSNVPYEWVMSHMNESRP